MVTKEVVNIIDKYYNGLSFFGHAENIDFNAILYLMFIDEYYETRLYNSMNNSEDEYGLNDCILKKLNIKLKQIAKCSKLIKNSKLSELPGLSHWIIPDVDNNSYIENGILCTNGEIQDFILSLNGTIENNVLIL